MRPKAFLVAGTVVLAGLAAVAYYRSGTEAPGEADQLRRVRPAYIEGRQITAPALV